MLAELYPTSVRFTGQGFTYGAGRGLSALASYTIGTLAERAGIGPALAMTSAFFVAGAVLVLLLPATEGREMKGEGGLVLQPIFSPSGLAIGLDNGTITRRSDWTTTRVTMSGPTSLLVI